MVGFHVLEQKQKEFADRLDVDFLKVYIREKCHFPNFLGK